ncbi:MAG: 3-oxoacyl-ACP synthase III [Anaerolineaceae bacterium]|nr:3-oxoacyl-ACP synthase III [Anaerolineaceae bacterium]
MHFENVYIEGMGYVIPERVITTAWLEEQLAPVYKKLSAPKNLFERLTGIKERRWWKDGMLPSDGAAEAGRRAIENAGFAKDDVESLVYAGVCHDYIEPANAVFVHDKIGLRPEALNFDVINACLGFITGMLMTANMIELGQIDVGLVVAAEAPEEGQLATMDKMLNNGVSKDDLRDNLASFTLGSAAVGMVLTSKKVSKKGKRLLGGANYSATNYSDLCVAQRTWMHTNSRKLLSEGTKVILKTWALFQAELGWSNDSIDRIFTHQVSEPQRLKALKAMGLPLNGVDYPNLKTMGNTASVAAPLCLAQGIADGILKSGDKVALLGVGSGINSLILGIQW